MWDPREVLTFFALKGSDHLKVQTDAVPVRYSYRASPGHMLLDRTNVPREPAGTTVIVMQPPAQQGLRMTAGLWSVIAGGIDLFIAGRKASRVRCRSAAGRLHHLP